MTCISILSSQDVGSPPFRSRYLLLPTTSFPSSAMAHMRRASVSSTLSNRSVSPLVFVAASNADTDEWVKAWKRVTTQGTDHMSHTPRLLFSDCFPHILPDLVESPVVAIDADESVEVACDVCRLLPIWISFSGSHQFHRPSYRLEHLV